jgi:hypothetical protein
MNNSQILDAALKVGIIISNAHGTGEGQNQPVSDCATLIDFAREIIRLHSSEEIVTDAPCE